MRRAILPSLLLVIAALTPAALSSTTASGSLPWLHVEHPTGALAQVTDSDGRTVILRGVNIVGLEDDFYRNPDGTAAGPKPFWPQDPAAYDHGRCPTNSHASAQPPVCERDLAQMHALGFNVIRLPVSWSLLEPTPGKTNSIYVNRVAQVVGWAKRQGIYTIIDMHEDSYSRFTPETAPVTAPGGIVGAAREGANHADGAPPWAVMANGVPAEAVIGQGELNAYVAAAFTSFWLDLTPTGIQGSLQQHYLAAMAALMRRFKDEPAVAGYEVMNEPLPGFIPPPVIDQGFLYPFYRRVITMMTGEVHDSKHLVLFEPIVLRNLTDVAVGASAPFTTYPNLVYAPHVYTHVFTAETFLPSPASTVVGAAFPLGYGQALTTATAEANALRAALLIGEYGNSNSQDDHQLAAETAAFDNAGVSSTLWQWKGNCGRGESAAQCHPGQWSMYYGSTSSTPAQDDGVIPSRVKYVARVYPRAVAGRLMSFSYDPQHRTFSLIASADQAMKAQTIVYLPALVTGAVHVTGAARLAETIRNPDGGRVVHVAVTGPGPYVVLV